MKKKIKVIIPIIVVLISLFFISTGFQKRTDVALIDYFVSDDGTAITLNIGIPTSMGYVRGFKDNGGGLKPHYITFYSTFGGLNSSFGANNKFTLELAPDDTEIYFNRPDKGYELVLVKDEETGQWVRAKDQNSDSEAFLAKNIITGESISLLENDGEEISNILENGPWNTEGTSDCFSNLEITIHGATYKYHSDCGTFNDSVNQRCLEVNEETKIHVNNILAEYISLASEKVSANKINNEPTSNGTVL